MEEADEGQEREDTASSSSSSSSSVRDAASQQHQQQQQQPGGLLSSVATLTDSPLLSSQESAPPPALSLASGVGGAPSSGVVPPSGPLSGVSQAATRVLEPTVNPFKQATPRCVAPFSTRVHSLAPS